MGNSDHPLHRKDAQEHLEELGEDAPDSLNAQIAKALGWRVEPNPLGFLQLFSPLRIRVGSFYATEEEAWWGVPEYELDLNAVFAELPEDNSLYDVKITALVAGGFDAAICRDDPPMGYTKVWQGVGTTRAEAAARALLAFAEWKAQQT